MRTGTKNNKQNFLGGPNTKSGIISDDKKVHSNMYNLCLKKQEKVFFYFNWLLINKLSLKYFEKFSH